jgi:ABC-type sugar transport system ATPase subunit
MTLAPPAVGEVLRARAVGRSFGPVRALHEVDFGLRAGEVHALLGENGAGKSTLVKILSGALAPSQGSLELDGAGIRFTGPRDAIDRGVAVVHQDYNLFNHRSVADNVVGIRRAPRLGPVLSRRRLLERAGDVLSALGTDLDPRRLVGELGAGQRKLVEIARALADESRVLILDEPTASLEPAETQLIFDLVERLRAQGQAVGIVTHRLDEVCRLADRATILRDGCLVGTLDRDEIDPKRMVTMMLGREPEPPASVSHVRQVDPVLRVTGLAISQGRRAFSIELNRGEVLGLTGLAGSGAVEVLRLLAGLGGPKAVAEVNGRAVRLRSPAAAVGAGIGFIPEDRKGAGLVLAQSVASNVVMSDLSSVVRRGWLLSRRRRQVAEDYRQRLDIRCADVDQPVEHLSGGNQQKVLIAKWVHAGVPVLLVEEPTHGVDVGARVAIHHQLLDFAARGGAIVLVSSEPEELIALCHRIGVLYAGELVATVDAATTDVAQLTSLQTGAFLAGARSGGPLGDAPGMFGSGGEIGSRTMPGWRGAVVKQGVAVPERSQ